MMNKDEFLNKLKPFIGMLCSTNDVAAVYLFGSYASGMQRELSDVDIAVLFHNIVCKEDYLYNRLKLLGELSAILGSDAIDLVVLNEAPPALGYRITKDGEMIYAAEKSKSQIVNYKVKTWDRYFDYKPAQKIFSAGLAKRIQEGRFGG